MCVNGAGDSKTNPSETGKREDRDVGDTNKNVTNLPRLHLIINDLIRIFNLKIEGLCATNTD